MTCDRCHDQRTILIIDDDPNVVLTVSRMLRLVGYDVLTAPNVESGLIAVASGQPDAVLVDLRMPLSDGLAFMRVLRTREHPRHTPVAIITGDYFLDEVVITELRELAAPVYFKPIWLEDLIAIVKRMCEPH
jgi:DNA-binding NtrC family response regulator